MSWNIAKEFPRSNLLYSDKIEVTLFEKWKVFRLLNWMNISFIYGNGTEGKIFVVCFLRSKTKNQDIFGEFSFYFQISLISMN